ncbi:hemerythrin domain-containing protein [Amycolatopsis pigmentata]|uniref:Hemerythrin domain-containing protein n=1 Tax=Amycolatopsis pigmentata TaxID=450801 RepID=A0ABW5FYI9_9PSEU
MDALEVLREDHQQVLDMLTRLEATPTVAAGTNGELLGARKKLVTEIVVAESRHEAVEERYFWPAVRGEVPGGDALAEHAVDQERAAKYLLAALEETPADHPDIDSMIERLIHEGREHIDYEQNEVWPKVREAIDKDGLDKLGTRLAEAKKTAPTRPHPDTPSAAPVQKAVGPLAALTDRIRDSIGRRRT